MPVNKISLLVLIFFLVCTLPCFAETLQFENGRALDVKLLSCSAEGLRCQYQNDPLFIRWSHFSFDEVKRLWMQKSLGDPEGMFELAEYCLQQKHIGAARDFFSKIASGLPSPITEQAKDRLEWIDTGLLEQEAKKIADRIQDGLAFMETQSWKKALGVFRDVMDTTDEVVLLPAIKKSTLVSVDSLRAIISTCETRYYQDKGYILINGSWQPADDADAIRIAMAHDPEQLRKTHTALLRSVFGAAGSDVEVAVGHHIAVFGNYKIPDRQYEILDACVDFCIKTIDVELTEQDVIAVVYLETRHQFRDYLKTVGASQSELDSMQWHVKGNSIVTYSYLDTQRLVHALTTRLLKGFFKPLDKDSGLFTDNLAFAVEFSLAPNTEWLAPLQFRARKGWLTRPEELIATYDLGSALGTPQRRSSGAIVYSKHIEAASLVYFLMQSPKHRKGFKSFLQGLRTSNIQSLIPPKDMKRLYDEWNKFILGM